MAEKDIFKRETTRTILKRAVWKSQKTLTQKKRDQLSSPGLTRPTGAADQQRWTRRPPGHRGIGDVTHGENRFL